MKFTDFFKKDMSNEKVKRINEEKEKDCPTCGGSGEDPDDPGTDCPVCKGEGIIEDGTTDEDWFDEKPKEAEVKSKEPVEVKKTPLKTDSWETSGYRTIRKGGPGTKKEGKEGKPEKDVKTFEVGDVLVLTNDKPSSKMPADAFDFLQTYKTFTVQSVNDKGKINLGCRISRNENGKGVEKIYMFSTTRFDKESDVKSGKKPAINPDAVAD